MLPSPRIFRSRWAALLWAGGIVWAAVDYAGAAQGGDQAPANTAGITDAAGDTANAADLAAVANLIDG